LDTSQFASARSEGSGFEETCGPEEFVNARHKKAGVRFRVSGLRCSISG
jgi:hypothetical protein